MPRKHPQVLGVDLNPYESAGTPAWFAARWRVSGSAGLHGASGSQRLRLLAHATHSTASSSEAASRCGII